MTGAAGVPLDQPAADCRAVEGDATTGTVARQLDVIAYEINIRLEKADEIDGKARDHRIAAGLLLKEAHALVPRRQWGRWLAANIKRSRQDVYRCLRLVESDNPAEQRQAQSRERAKVREQVQRSRASARSGTYVCDKSAMSEPALANNPIRAVKALAASVADPVDLAMALVSDFSGVDLERFKTWFVGYVNAGVAAPPRHEVAEEHGPVLPEPCVATAEATDGREDKTTVQAADAEGSARPSTPALAGLGTSEDAPPTVTPLKEPAPAGDRSPTTGGLVPQASNGGSTAAQIVSHVVTQDARSEEAVTRDQQPKRQDTPVFEPSDDGGLTAIWKGLKQNTQRRARWWIEQSCPPLIDHPDIHFRIIETLQKQFCPTALKASPAQRQRFLECTAERSKPAA